MLAVLLLSIGSIAGIAAAGPPTATMALVFPPWWSEQRSFLAAAEGGPVIAMGGLPFVVLVPSNSHPSRARGEVLRVFAANRPGCFSSGEKS